MGSPHLPSFAPAEFQIGNSSVFFVCMNLIVMSYEAKPLKLESYSPEP